MRRNRIVQIVILFFNVQLVVAQSIEPKGSFLQSEAKIGEELQFANHPVAAAIGLTAEQVERVYRDIDQKRRTTRYLHARPLLVEQVPEIGD